MYASFKFALGGKDAGVGTVPIILIEVPCCPLYPEKPL